MPATLYDNEYPQVESLKKKFLTFLTIPENCLVKTRQNSVAQQGKLRNALGLGTTKTGYLAGVGTKQCWDRAFV